MSDGEVFEFCSRGNKAPNNPGPHGKKPQRKTVTKRAVDALKPGTMIADDEVRGFVARRLPSGTVTYGYRYMNADGAQRWLPLGLHGKLTPDNARTLAKKAAGQVATARTLSPIIAQRSECRGAIRIASVKVAMHSGATARAASIICWS
jgi:hypothetical protein